MKVKKWMGSRVCKIVAQHEHFVARPQSAVFYLSRMFAFREVAPDRTESS